MKHITDYYEQWRNDVDALNAILHREGMDFKIDEVALMFGDRPKALEWITEAVKAPNVELFNKAEDEVHTYPFGTDYDVHYYFLDTPYEFRVECMALGSGLSPLHEAMKPYAQRMPSALPKVVHYSFKVPDEDTYVRVMNWFKAAEWFFAQACESMYGRFSYWRLNEHDAEETGITTYVKPRVNLRDSVSAAALDFLESKV